MAVRDNPAVASTIRKGGLRDIKVGNTIGILDEFKDVIEQRLFSFCLITGLRCSGRNLQMFVVQSERHGPQYNVHTLLDAMLVGIYLGYIIVPDNNSSLPELPQVLKVGNMRFEGIVFRNGYWHFVEVQFQIDRLVRGTIMIHQTEGVLDKLIIQEVVAVCNLFLMKWRI